MLLAQIAKLLKVALSKDRLERISAARAVTPVLVPMMLAAASLVIVAIEPTPAAEISRRPQPIGLTVAILDLAEAPDLAPGAQPDPPKPAWRTSFGSERQTEAETKPTAGSGPLAALANSDAVLIQGVKAAAPLRRLFPPRTWRLIVSRQIITPQDAADNVGASANLPAATAIAVKARRSLRVTARALALRLNEAPPSPTSGDETAEAAVATQTSAIQTSVTPLPAAAATAVRLVERGRTLWLASVALPSLCASTQSAPCPAQAELDAWRAAKRGAGEATLVGGRLAEKNTATPMAETPQACRSHGIDSDLESEIVPHDEATPLSQTGSGCISIVRVGG